MSPGGGTENEWRATLPPVSRVRFALQRLFWRILGSQKRTTDLQPAELTSLGARSSETETPRQRQLASFGGHLKQRKLLEKEQSISPRVCHVGTLIILN